MFKYKFIVGFVVLLVLQTAFAVYMIQSRLIPTAVEDTDISLQRSASLIEKSHRLDEFALEERSRALASTPELRETMSTDYEAQRQQLLEEGESARQAHIQRHYDVHGVIRDREDEFGDERLDEYGDKRNLDLSLMNRRPLDHHMFMVVDDEGELVAARGSGPTDAVRDDFATPFPIVLDAMDEDTTKIDMWDWSWGGGDGNLYVVAISPIHSADGDEPVGAFVLGNRVTDGFAERGQAMIRDGLDGEGAADLTPRERVQAPDLTFFRGQSIHSSTLSSSERSDLQNALFDEHDILDQEEPEKVLNSTIGGQTYRTMVRFFPGQFETDNPAGVVFVTSHDEAIQPHESARSNVLFLSVVILLVGVGLFYMLYQMFVQPFARLEDGIQNILSGDKDYDFDESDSHETAENMAHHLNLMSAFLQGKPMPDDDVQSLGGWDAFDVDQGQTESSGSSSIAGVDMSALGKKTSGSDDDGDDESTAAEATSEEPT